MKRKAAIMKAQSIIDNPAAYTRATSYGALKYIMNIEVDKETGEIKESKKGKPCFNFDVISEEEKFDGYYAIVTNVFNEGIDKGKFEDSDIIDIYRGLWRVEDSFGITKDELETRPIFVWNIPRIRAHFLTCYVALIILRLIQKRCAYKHSPEKLIEAMNNISCSLETENLYLFDYRSDVSDDLGNAFKLDFSMQRLTRSEIKKNIGSVKKP
jgi:transposase